MPTEKDIEDKLIGFICDNFMVEADEFNLEESLVDQGVIDSIGLLEIAAFMESEFGMTVVEDDMNRDNFGSIRKMISFIVRTSTK